MVSTAPEKRPQNLHANVYTDGIDIRTATLFDLESLGVPHVEALRIHHCEGDR